jgi:ATP-dependent Clp protease ATP-binding subunit ClpA
MEASAAGRPLIEPEDIFLGLCKLDEILTGENVHKLIEQFGDLNHLRQESSRLTQYFTKSNPDHVSVRRFLRGYLGRGSQPPGGFDEPVHRSDACKQIFQKAIDIADSNNSADLHAFHLLAALLQAPSPEMSKAIQRCGSTVDSLREGLD